jgi:hypothetical protein
MNHYMTESEQTDQLTLAPSSSIEVGWQEKNKVAELCKAIVTATAIKIGGRSYIPIEGWLSIAAAAGYTPATEEPERTEEGYRVKAVLRRDSDGVVISTAYGFVGDDEPLWARRPRHANEAMAQTRAMARVCANKFRFIPVMMKIEHLSTTPYEEMPGVDEHPSSVRTEPPIRRGVAKEADRAREAQEAQEARAAKPAAQPPPPQQPKPEVPNGNGGGENERVTGVVSKCRTSEFEGRTYYWASLGGRAVYTADQQLGKDLLASDGHEVEALVVKGKNPNKYKLLDFFLAGTEEVK